MVGYQITFFTLQDKRHNGKPLADWLLQLCKQLQIRGATVVMGSEGVDHKGRFHSSHFFELADRPVEVTMVVSKEECERIFDRLGQEAVEHLFYVKTQVEFGCIGD